MNASSVSLGFRKRAKNLTSLFYGHFSIPYKMWLVAQYQTRLNELLVRDRNQDSTFFHKLVIRTSDRKTLSISQSLFTVQTFFEGLNSAKISLSKLNQCRTSMNGCTIWCVLSISPININTLYLHARGIIIEISFHIC